MKLDRNEVTLLDVREDHEWNEGHIQEADHIYVGYIKKMAKQLPREQPIATTCAWGGRGSLAASILKSMGFKEVYNLLGGMDAWTKKGYSILKETK